MLQRWHALCNYLHYEEGETKCLKSYAASTGCVNRAWLSDKSFSDWTLFSTGSIVTKGIDKYCWMNGIADCQSWPCVSISVKSISFPKTVIHHYVIIPLVCFIIFKTPHKVVFYIKCVLSILIMLGILFSSIIHTYHAYWQLRYMKLS